MKDKS